MTVPAVWQCAVEIHPPEWRFPAGRSWIAGWVWSPSAGAAADVRVWLGDRVFLGLHGLPRAEIEQRFRSHAGPPYAGFSALLEPAAGATQLRVEVRDAAGDWQPVFSTAITAAAGAAAPALPPLASLAEDRLGELLRLHASRPEVALASLADEVVAAVAAEPLNSLPNPPFFGALEEPKAEGWIRYGRLAITGWLGHRERRIRRITAMVDATELALPHGLPRGDISRDFPPMADGDNLAFVGHADLAAGLGRPVLLKLFAELDNGEKHLAFAQRFTPRVIMGSDRPLPPRSRRTFARAVWALRGAAGRHGLPLGSLRALRDGVAAAWENYSSEAPAPLPAPPVVAPGGDAKVSQPVRPLGVLVVTHNLNLEGAPWFILEYARHLAAQPGWSVRVISPQDGPLRARFAEAGLPVEIVDVRAVLAARTVAEFSAAVDEFAGRLDWNCVDLVVANTMVAFWAVHAARRARRPSVLYIHESAPIRRFFAPMLAPVLFSQVEAAFTGAQRVVFIASASRAVFGRLDQRGNFRSLPSWIDVDGIQRFAAQHDRAALRAERGVPRNAIVFANIGSVCERKGQHIFIRAIAELKFRLAATVGLPPLQFLMVGARPGAYLEELRHDVRWLGLDGVEFVNEVPGPLPYYGLADIFVCSSFEEAFPRVLLEAATFGLPIVSTNVHGIAEMLTTDDAWLVAPGDATALAGAMEQALRAHLAGDRTRANRAQEAVVTRFSAAHSLPLHRALASEAAEA